MGVSELKMKNLSSRILSALIALALLILAVYFGREKGVYLIALFAVIRGSFEISRMLFNSDYPRFVKFILMSVALVVFLFISQEGFRPAAGLALIFGFLFFVTVAILFHRHFTSPELVFNFVAKSCLSLIYVCFLPAAVVWITQTNNGMEWFFCLLGVVFAGDIGAYVCGVRFGTKKLAPMLSPNKSLQGALGGLMFSTLISGAFIFVLPNTPLIALLLCGLLGGFLGQVGDFFESLLKRVSGVKDSGTIMPGHGGVLDRLDGVLMAAPLFYIAATYFSL